MLKRFFFPILVFLALCSGVTDAEAQGQLQTAAFPGAEGFGRYTSGGRGGKVYHVTTLEDTEHRGSLRWAIKREGPRTIVFDVAGNIELIKPLVIRNDSITIAGQTAPGDGICLKNYPLRIEASNVILRFIRCRLGYDKPDQEGDAITAYSKNNSLHDVIIDHCSASWSVDECFSAYGIRNLTVQWCFIEESLFNSGHHKGAHGFGGLWGGAPATFHHNLVAHHSSRVPRLCGSRFSNDAEAEKVDLRNNVFYNWGPTNGGYGGDGGQFNFVNNYYKPGPRTIRGKQMDSKTGKEKEGTAVVYRLFQPNGDPGGNAQPKGVWGKFYMSGNFLDTSVEGMTPGQKFACFKVNENNYEGLIPGSVDEVPLPEGGKYALIMDEPFDPGQIKTHPADVAYALVINLGGCSLSRDTVDARIARETYNGTYTYTGSTYKRKYTTNSKGNTDINLYSKYGIIDKPSDVGGWPELKATEDQIALVSKDENENGIPDGWETGYFGSLVDGNGHDKNPRYTNLEVYLNWIVSDIIKAQR